MGFVWAESVKIPIVRVSVKVPTPMAAGVLKVTVAVAVVAPVPLTVTSVMVSLRAEHCVYRSPVGAAERVRYRLAVGGPSPRPALTESWVGETEALRAGGVGVLPPPEPPPPPQAMSRTNPAAQKHPSQGRIEGPF